MRGGIVDISRLLASCSALLATLINATGQCTSYDPVTAQGAFAGFGRELILSQHGTSGARVNGHLTSFDIVVAEGTFADCGGVE